MNLNGQVGPQVLADGSVAPIRMGKSGEASFSELNARYHEQAYRGNIFFAANQAVVTFAANGLTTSSAVGLGLYNPPSSTKNIVPVQIELLMTNYVTTSTDVQVIGVVSSAYSATNPTTAGGITIQNAKGAPAASGTSAQAATSVTFAANTVIWKPLFSAFVTTTIAAAIPTMNSMVGYDIGGSLVLAPGTGMAIIANNASTGLASITWMEIPI